MIFNSLKLWIARHRKLQFVVRGFNLQTASVRVIHEIRIEIPLSDITGPAFYLNYGGPAAFYHYEAIEKIEIARLLPVDGVFLDIGANIGLFSAYLSTLFPSVRCYAFEPHPLLAECIRETVRKSPFPGISVEEICLSDSEGKLNLRLHRRNCGGNSILDGNIGDGEEGDMISVQSRTLDSWVLEKNLSRIDVIKMDVQGAEEQVLSQAGKCLERFRPALLIEIETKRFLDPSSHWKSVLAMLQNLRYRARIAGSADFLSLDQLPKQMSERHAREIEHSNYVFVANLDRA